MSDHILSCARQREKEGKRERETHSEGFGEADLVADLAEKFLFLLDGF